MNTYEIEIARKLLVYTKNLSKKVYDEIVNGDIDITVTKGRLYFRRKSKSFPVSFDFKVPDKYTISSFFSKHLLDE